MARDTYHEIVRSALESEGWIITDDPLIIEAGKRKIQVDLGAERLLGAAKGDEMIAVEVKSFTGFSTISEFYHALGQFNFYQQAVEEKMPERSLFLAIPDDTYEDFFSDPFVTRLISRHHVNMIVYSIELKKIVSWIS